MAMKRKLFLLSLLLFVFGAGVVTAGSINGNYNGNPIVRLFAGDKELKPDVPAQIIDGRTMVPLYVLQDLGATVKWDAKNYRVDVEMPVRTVPVLIQSQLDELSKYVYKVYGSTDDPSYMNLGSGFIIDGTFITNYHVAGESEYARVEIDGMPQIIRSFKFADKDNDLLGFKVTGGKSLPVSTEIPQVGDPVYAIGFAGDELTITEGVIQLIDDEDIVHTAQTAPGGSGSVLLSGDGKVIGVNKEIMHYETGTVTFATPIKYVLDLNQ